MKKRAPVAKRVVLHADEVAERLGCCVTKVYQMAKNGELDVVYVGRHLKFSKAGFERRFGKIEGEPKTEVVA
jgi:excisionase family DNA binding protein